MLGPVIMCILAVTLAGSLGIAVYFATALKDTQEKQIDFLHAHFEMSIRNQNINQLSFREREILAVSYCKMMDKFYTVSELKKLYRGCEVISLRNDKINFTLFFTESGPAPEDAIMQVIQDSAPTVSAPGRAEPLVMVDQLKVDLTTAKIKLETKKEPENFSKIIVDKEIAAAKNVLTPNPRNIVDSVGDSSAQLTVSIETTPATTSPTFSTTTSSITTTVSTTTISPTTTTTTAPPTSTSSPALLAEKYVKSTTRSTNFTTTYNKQPTSPEPLNPCEGKNGGFYPHPTECNLYYECQNEVSVLLYCGQVMVFDFNSKVCVVKTADSLCPNITHYVGDISSRHVTNTSIILPVYEWNPCANNKGDYFPHPVECNLFFQCDHGKSVLRLCQSGLLYDWETKVCSRQSDQVTCPDPSKAPPRPEDTFTVAPPSITTKNTSKNLYPTRPAYSRTPCKTSKDGNNIFPHPDDCNLYIFCNDGVENTMTCDDGLVFDPEITTCRKPTTELHCPDLTPCKGMDLGYYPHPFDCSKFIICETEKEVIQSCLHGLVWDPTKKSCTLRTENSICP
ncbi:probable chitinase 10 [Patella vulgata]|uniref:probable chitinase 10 n=1 Tax=Patella vulgata TaxID=6465 RepID=UPI0024A7CF9F|nr:probable chitinase 10 [Patella vulgata]